MDKEIESCKQIPNKLDLFSPKPINVAFQQTDIVEYNTVTAPGTWPAKFIINTGLSYLDLSHCYLQSTFSIFKTKIVKDKDNKDITQILPITKDDKVSLINGFGATGIKNVKVLINGRQIYNGEDCYSYHAYFRRRLGIESSRNIEDLQLAGYFEDDEYSQDSGTGFEKRGKLFENNGKFHAITQLDVDFFRQNKLLLNMLSLDIEITPQNMAFCLIAKDGGTYTGSITGYKLYIKQHHVIPSLDAVINKTLATEIAKYPYTRSLIKKYYISYGRHDFSTNMFTDYIPKRVFVALVNANSFNGTPTTSPFEFKPYNIDRIHVSVNNKIVPTYPYEMGNGDFARPFKDLIDMTDKTDLTYLSYVNHSCIFAFDFQHYNSDKAVNPQELGTTHLSIKFSSPVPAHGLQAVVYAEFDSNIYFDFGRNMSTKLPI